MKKSIICIVVFFLFVTTTTFAIVFGKVEVAKGCSKITFNNGQTAEIDVVQITADEIKYKPCGKPNDTLILVSKAEVLYLKNAEGDMVYRSTKTAKVATVTTTEKVNNSTDATDRLARIGLFLSLGTLFAGPIGALCGLIVSIIAFNRIKNGAGSERGRKTAIWGMIVSGLLLLLTILLYGIVIFA